MFKKKIFSQIIHSAATQPALCVCVCVYAKNEIQQDSSTCQGALPRTELSEAMRKRTGGDTPTFQRAGSLRRQASMQSLPEKPGCLVCADQGRLKAVWNNNFVGMNLAPPSSNLLNQWLCNIRRWIYLFQDHRELCMVWVQNQQQ